MWCDSALPAVCVPMDPSVSQPVSWSVGPSTLPPPANPHPHTLHTAGHHGLGDEGVAEGRLLHHGLELVRVGGHVLQHEEGRRVHARLRLRGADLLEVPGHRGAGCVCGGGGVVWLC